MNFTFLVVTCLLGWTFAFPLTHSEEVSLQRRGPAPPVRGGKVQPEGESSESSSRSGTNDETHTATDPPDSRLPGSSSSQTETLSHVEIVNQIREFLERASELVDDDEIEKECRNFPSGSPLEEACQACNKVTACTKLADGKRMNCVCTYAAALQVNAGTCNALIATSNGKLLPGNLAEACDAAQQGG